VNEHYELSWNQVDFSSKSKLFFLSNDDFRDVLHNFEYNPKKLADAYGALSSTYYSIAGTAVAQIKARPWKVFWWGFLGGWCYLRMLPLSNKVVSFIGYDDMSADQCDVRQSILRRRRQFEEAEKCIDIALQKEMSDTTYCLLEVGLAEVKMQLGRKFPEIERSVNSALSVLDENESIDVCQKIRILKQAGKIAAEYNEFELSGRLIGSAQTLATKNNVRDQMIKI